MANTNVIEILNLSFSYSKKHGNILNNLSMHVPKGSIYGFLGANGAGKSTTMQLLTGILTSTNKKQIMVFDEVLEDSIPGVFHKLGSLIESPSLYDHLNAYDNLKIVADIKQLNELEIYRILELVGLKDKAHQKVKAFSTGMKQRLGIGMALMGQPELLLLDEPINGLDPQGVIDIRDLLVHLNTEYGTTIFISSHLLDEIEKICTHIGVLVNGNLAFEGTMQALKAEAKVPNKMQIHVDDAEQWCVELEKKFPSETIYIENHTIGIESSNLVTRQAILATLLAEGAIISDVKTSKDLESLFLDITN